VRFQPDFHVVQITAALLNGIHTEAKYLFDLNRRAPIIPRDVAYTDWVSCTPSGKDQSLLIYATPHDMRPQAELSSFPTIQNYIMHYDTVSCATSLPYPPAKYPSSPSTPLPFLFFGGCGHSSNAAGSPVSVKLTIAIG